MHSGRKSAFSLFPPREEKSCIISAMNDDENQISGLGDRLRQVRESMGYRTVVDAANAFGFPASTLTQHESGLRAPNLTAFVNYALKYGVSLEWLATGVGQMREGDVRDIPLAGILADDCTVSLGYEEVHRIPAFREIDRVPIPRGYYKREAPLTAIAAIAPGPQRGWVYYAAEGVQPTSGGLSLVRLRDEDAPAHRRNMIVFTRALEDGGYLIHHPNISPRIVSGLAEVQPIVWIMPNYL